MISKATAAAEGIIDVTSHIYRWCTWAISYISSAGGLVPESCFPYVASNQPCPSKCKDGKDWRSSHVCKCSGSHTCVGDSAMKSCLSSGPITLGMGVCQSFMNYRSGVYKCDCGSNYIGLHAVLGVGYKDPCQYHVRNSWGTSWGQSGYFDIACGTCGVSGTYPNGNAMCQKVG